MNSRGLIIGLGKYNILWLINPCIHLIKSHLLYNIIQIFHVTVVNIQEYFSEEP